MSTNTLASDAGPDGSTVILEAQGIVKVLGTPPTQVRVLKGVDLKLHTGELTLMMGPSGSGKTTLLSILGCILSPTEGKLALAGISTSGMKAVANTSASSSKDTTLCRH
jgi:putative ABC transport system ATP-binding protein